MTTFQIIQLVASLELVRILVTSILKINDKSYGIGIPAWVKFEGHTARFLHTTACLVGDACILYIIVKKIMT